ncbi:MAG: hypothetical protein JST54_25075 [Deltaproteobacteria bacterium]|nr:hypothetical protein [Deltaproteobacteria bacterium]
MDALTALHDRVIAQPRNDDARLRYAAALRPTDPARAEFIVLQVEYSKAKRTGASVPDTYVRRQVLYDTHRAEWSAELESLGVSSQFLRGFPEWIFADAARFLAIADELYRRAPVLHLTLTGVKPMAAALFESPHLARILTMDLSRNELGDAEAKLIAESSRLGALQWLDLAQNQIGMRGLEALAASTKLPHVDYLGFGSNLVDDPTPPHADEYDVDSPVAVELQRRFGPRAWLSARPRANWPPYREYIA